MSRPISFPHINFPALKKKKNADNRLTDKIFTLNLDRLFELLKKFLYLFHGKIYGTLIPV